MNDSACYFNRISINSCFLVVTGFGVADIADNLETPFQVNLKPHTLGVIHCNDLVVVQVSDLAGAEGKVMRTEETGLCSLVGQWY